jgi:hypothetical protein
LIAEAREGEARDRQSREGRSRVAVGAERGIDDVGLSGVGQAVAVDVEEHDAAAGRHDGQRVACFDSSYFTITGTGSVKSLISLARALAARAQ